MTDLDFQPDSEEKMEDFDIVDLSNLSGIDDVNVHILQELEDDFS